MVVIIVKDYNNADIFITIVHNKELFWVRMNDMLDGLDIKNISDAGSKEIYGIYGTKKPTSEQIREFKRSEEELIKILDIAPNVSMFVMILWKR